MANQSLGLGTEANDGTGDTLRVASDKINDNFLEIYTLIGDESSLTTGISATASVVTLTAPTITGVVGGTQTSATITTLTGTTLNAGTLAIAAGSITDSSGAISFGNENLTTTGTITGALATAAQTAITSVGTLTALQVDNININGNAITSTAGTDLTISPLSGQQIVLDGTIVIDAGVVTGATSVTSSAFVGDITGDVTGNADTATALATARTIGGTSFDGSANIAVALASVGTAVTVADESSDTTCFPLFTTAATGDLPPKSGSNLTFNSSSGLLTSTLFAGDLTGDVTGNADTATTLATARTIGGTSFNGSANIAVALAAAATTLETARTLGGVSFNGSANINLPGVNAAGNQSTSGLAATATALATARTIGGTSFDGSANIAVGLAAEATILETARTIGGTSFDGSANIAVGLATLATTVTITDNESTNESNALIFTAGGDVDGGNLGLESDGTLTYNPSTGIVTATGFAGALTGNVTGNASGTALTVTQAAQTAITSVGTLTALQVDNLNINGNTLSSTAGTDLLITPLSGQQIVLDGALVIDAGVVTGGTSITSTAFVGNLTGTVATVTQNSITTMTGLVTTGALGAGSIAAGFGAIDNGTSGIRSNTITAETAFVPDANDGADIGTTSLGFNDIFLADAGRIVFGNDQDINLTHAHNTGLTTNADFTVGDDLFVSGGVIDLKNTGAASKILLYCESNNAHAQTLQSQPHSAGATNTSLLPTGASSSLVSLVSADTLTNKTLTAPVLEGAILHGILPLDTEHGAGAIATSFAPITRRSTLNGVITTKIHFDLTALGGKGATANDVIGLPAGGNAFIGRYVVSTCGIVFRAELACIELPAVASGTLNTDIDIATNSAGDIEYDAAGGTAKLFNTGGMVAGQELSNITPAITANDFFYLVEGGTDAADAVYNAGQFVLTLYGHTIS